MGKTLIYFDLQKPPSADTQKAAMRKIADLTHVFKVACDLNGGFAKLNSDGDYDATVEEMKKINEIAMVRPRS